MCICDLLAAYVALGEFRILLCGLRSVLHCHGLFRIILTVTVKHLAVLDLESHTLCDLIAVRCCDLGQSVLTIRKSCDVDVLTASLKVYLVSGYAQILGYRAVLLLYLNFVGITDCSGDFQYRALELLSTGDVGLADGDSRGDIRCFGRCIPLVIDEMPLITVVLHVTSGNDPARGGVRNVNLGIFIRIQEDTCCVLQGCLLDVVQIPYNLPGELIQPLVLIVAVRAARCARMCGFIVVRIKINDIILSDCQFISCILEVHNNGLSFTDFEGHFLVETAATGIFYHFVTVDINRCICRVACRVNALNLIRLRPVGSALCSQCIRDCLAAVEHRIDDILGHAFRILYLKGYVFSFM